MHGDVAFVIPPDTLVVVDRDTGDTASLRATPDAIRLAEHTLASNAIMSISYDDRHIVV